jgi:type VI secretion system VgrG family protein
MAIDETKRFTFASQGMPDDTFSVVTFKGTEGISRLYEFDITLASDDGEIDLKGVLQNPATLTIKGGDQDLPIHGAVSQFEQLNEVKGHYFYRALLVPRLRQANLYHENQLFLDKKVPDIIEEILKQAGLTTQDYELKLTRSYPQWEYICQYRETDLDFISRWMEREGIYYYFEQGEQNEKIIITDSSTAHKDIPGDATIPYFPPSGLGPEEEAIRAFVCTQKMLPKKVILKDYNYRKPSLDLKAEAEVDSKGRGDVYLYGEHFKDPGQGNELAKIRAEEIKCRENIFHGEGTAPNLCPGFLFELEGHYRDGYNQKYLILEVEHEGHQTGSFWAGVGEEPAEGEKKLTYANRFTAIPSDVQFRPERTTPKSKFSGTMNATVDAAGDGQQAEIDDQGRYKVILPFDQSGNKDGKASRWVRMAQPYAGSEYGMHFPLHKGAEVLLTFVDGDPDRPIISGSVPNPETTSPVTSANQTRSIVRDNFGNEIIFDATPSDEHIRLYSPHHQSGLEIGRSIVNWTASNKSELTLGNKIESVIGTKGELIVGNLVDVKLGTIWSGFVGLEFAGSYGGRFVYNDSFEVKSNKETIVHISQKDVLARGNADHIIAAGDQVCIVGGAKARPQDNYRSITNVFPELISLSVGRKNSTRKLASDRTIQRHPQGGELYNQTPSSTKVAVALLLSGINTLAAMAVGEIPAMVDYQSTKSEDILEYKGYEAAVGIVSATLGIAGMFVLKYFLNKELGEQKIEPVTHRRPDAKIQLKRGGTIEMFSDERQTLAVGGRGSWRRRDRNKKEGSELYLRRDGSRIEITRNKIEIASSGRFSRAAGNPPTADQFSSITIDQGGNITIQAAPNKNIILGSKGGNFLIADGRRRIASINKRRVRFQARGSWKGDVDFKGKLQSRHLVA